MKLRFILNPCSGRNRRRTWLAEHLRGFITEHRLDALLTITTAPGHATRLARAALAEGCDRVIAIGGDGTMNEVAQALVNSRVALGLVPCGSGNGLALHLGLSSNLQCALELAIAPNAVLSEIDTGTANGHPFFNVMGCGFDADISERFNRLQRRGFAAYARTGLAAFLLRRTQRVVIRSAGQIRELDTLLIAVANSDQYGNNARIAPGARANDGKLDLIAIPPINVVTALPLIGRLFSGKLLDSPKVVHLRGPEFIIERREPGLIHTDGETHLTSAEIQIVVRPRSLRVLVPAPTAPGPVNVSTRSPHETIAAFQPALSNLLGYSNSSRLAQEISRAAGFSGNLLGYPMISAGGGFGGSNVGGFSL